MNRLNTDERGGILVLSAVLIPLFLLMAALVVDGGNWFTHKRQLQNRADAGALAAGVEYVSQLKNCLTSPVTANTAIADVAKDYAGTADTTIPGPKYNQQIAKQSELTVEINDGANDPCTDHAVATPPDPISPNGGYWTDVKVRETNLGTLFGGFGLNLPAVSAQARVEVNQIIGIRHGGLPLVTETGDKIECVWAKFVRGSDGSSSGFVVTPNNPILLTGGPSTWTGNVTNLQFSGDDDVAIEYYAGSKDGSAPCNFASANKRPLPHAIGEQLDPIPIDWLNVYDEVYTPGADKAPALRAFSLTADTCGGPGFLYTASTAPTVQCRVGFSAWIDTGPNNVTGEITVEPVGTAVNPVTVSYDTTGSNPNLTNVTGTITIFPNEVVTPATGYSQDYTQTGSTYFKVDWHQTSGKVGTGGQSNCPTGSNCFGTFPGDTVSGVGGNIQQATYTSDPLGSTPLVATSLSLLSRSFRALGQTGPFTISFTHTGIDQEGLALVRDSVQSSGNRTRAVWCGGSSSGSPAIKDAVENGCQVPLVVNQRNDSCAPPLGGWPSESDPPPVRPLDCVQLEQGNKTGPIRDGTQTRFTCTDNNWVPGGPLPSEGDQRWAYIVLTGFGRIIPAPNNGFLPIEGLVRIYVTGWGGKNYAGASGSPEYVTCGGENDSPPRGFDGNGAQIWGHLVDIITLSDDVIVGDEKCNLDVSIITCKPQLVR